MIVCSECEAENIDEAKVCSKCGTMINPEIIEKDENNYNMVIKIGWICILLCWPLGLLIGLSLLRKNEKRAKKHGLAQTIMGISLFCVVLIILLLSV